MAYGVEIPGESIYPNYVTSVMNGENEAEPEDREQDQETAVESHVYYISEEEFNMSPGPSEEIIEEEESGEESWYAKVIEEVRNREDLFESRDLPGIMAVSGRLFNINAKPLVTIDELGFSFNSPCRTVLNSTDDESAVEVLYNPVRQQLCVRICVDGEYAGKMHWVRQEGGKIVMKRCPAGALTSAIYLLMGWEKENRYKIPGIVWKCNDETRLLFDLTDPIICMKCNKAVIQEEKQDSGLEIAVENLSGYSKTELAKVTDGIEAGALGVRCENRSRAVYFTNSEKDHRSEENVPESKDTTSHGLVIKRTDTDLHIMQIGWEEGFCAPSIVRLPYSNDREEEYSDFGWTTQYRFPTREEVEKHKKELERTCGADKELSKIREAQDAE